MEATFIATTAHHEGSFYEILHQYGKGFEAIFSCFKY